VILILLLSVSEGRTATPQKDPTAAHTLARLGFHLSPDRIKAFEVAYREKVVPVLRTHGLTASSQKGRATTDSVFARAFAFKTPSEFLEIQSALLSDPAFEEVRRNLGTTFGTSDTGGLIEVSFEIYWTPAGSGAQVAAGPGTRVTAGSGQGHWRTYGVAEGLASNRILSMFQDREGILWFGTFNEGVSRDDGETFTTFTTQEGLADNRVRSILQDREGTLWFGTDGSESSPHEMNINFFPREQYEANGRSSNGWLMVQKSDIIPATSRVEDFIIQNPSTEDCEFAADKWGKLLESVDSDHGKACEIAKSIIIDLTGHNGIPSDIMDASTPLEQYRRAVSGEDHVWCGNFAAIFSHACNALGIPARRISMHRDSDTSAPESSDYVLRLATGHGTTEIFDRDANQWVWIDAHFSILGAWLGDMGPLNLMELHRFVNSPARLQHLQVLYYNFADKTTRRMPLLECERSYSCLNSFKRTQKLYYSKRT
jgi:hypothetical protein